MYNTAVRAPIPKFPVMAHDNLIGLLIPIPLGITL